MNNEHAIPDLMNTIEQGRNEPGMEEFLKEKATRVKESTLRSYANYIGIVRRRSPVPLLELSESQARDLALELSKMDGGDTLGRTVRMFLSFHGREKIAKMFKIRRKEKPLKPSDILTVDEVQTMLQACESMRDRALIVVLWETGSRINEVLSLNLGDVSEVSNGERTFLELYIGEPKVDGQQHSSILVEGSCIVREWIEVYPFHRTAKSPLFPSMDPRKRGRRLTYSGAYQLIQRIMDRSGIERHVYPHLFRHSRATHLLRVGISEAIVKKTLGWKPNSQMLARYSHLVPEDAHNALLQAHGLEPIGRIRIGGLKTEELGSVPPVVFTDTPTVRIGDIDMDSFREKVITVVNEGTAVGEVLDMVTSMKRELEEIKRKLYGPPE